MILNIVVLLIINTVLPYIPLPSQLALSLPFIHLYIQQPTAYEYMNLKRLHTKQQFKKTFRESMKILHPDKGGDQTAFSKVQNLKKIMEQEINYYDTLNVTDADLVHSNIPLQSVVSSKQTTYKVQAFIYYFIVLLYSLTYTIQDDMRPARKYLLLLISIFAILEISMYTYPQHITLIDLINNKVPIFIQKTILKTFLSSCIAIICTKYKRKITSQQLLLENLKKQHSEQEYIKILTNLQKIYKERVIKKEQHEKSWMTKIRKLIAKGFGLLVLYVIIKNFMGFRQDTNVSKNDM